MWIEANHTCQDPGVGAIVLVIALVNLARLTSVGNDDDVAMRFKQPTDPARMSSGLQRDQRETQSLEVLAEAHLGGAYPLLAAKAPSPSRMQTWLK